MKPIGGESEKFGALLESQGLKYTHERQLLLEEVLHQKKHFDADSLYESMKKKGIRIARDTVYRTLPLLLECGILQKSVGEGKRDYYERTGAKGHHDHMICIKCARVIEFASDLIEKYQDAICEQYSFKLLFHDHRLFGYCRTCH